MMECFRVATGGVRIFFVLLLACGHRAALAAEFTVKDIGKLGGTGGILLTRAQGINAAGKVVGSSPTASFRAHAFAWSNGVMTDLGTLGGSESSATAINEAGQIVGASLLPGDGARHAFL